MEVVIIIGTGLSIGILRIFISKKSGKSKKLKYYNYSKYTLKHKRLGQSLNEQSKVKF